MGGMKVDHKLKMPAARRRDWMGKTSTRDTPRPTVRPSATDTSCSAVWKPERYTWLKFCPESDALTKENRPPLATPEGSWNRMAVICANHEPRSVL